MKYTTELRKLVFFISMVLFSIIVFTKDTGRIINIEDLLIDRGSMRSSWYGPGFDGKRTASGEVYNQNSLTAAHRSLKFGTLLKIINPDNGKMIVVRINDRGPFIKGRDLDLSKGAAIELGMIEKGVIDVQVKEIDVSSEKWSEIFKEISYADSTNEDRGN